MSTVFRCRCGATALEADGRPIVATICACSHCAAAERAFVSMGVPPSQGSVPGMSAILYRKDRVHLLSGREHLRPYRLTRDSPTRRVLAVCCTTPMFLDFEKGFWLSLYRDRANVPDAEVGRRVSGLLFAAQLVRTFVEIGFRRPKVDPGLQGVDEVLFAP